MINSHSDFLDWVNRYLRPESEVGCTAEDLYSARCALVHSGAAESRMSRGGQANELWYVTSPRSINLVEDYAQKIDSNAKVIYFTDLVSAFAAASERFSEEISSDRVSQQVVNERIRRWLRFVPSSSLEESEN